MHVLDLELEIWQKALSDISLAMHMFLCPCFIPSIVLTVQFTPVRSRPCVYIEMFIEREQSARYNGC